MFGAPARKYAPARSALPDQSPLEVQAVQSRRFSATSSDPWELTWPLPGAKMRLSKASKGAALVRAVRRHPSALAPSLESLEAAWSDRVPAPEGLPSPDRPSCGGQSPGSGGPPRGRRKGFKPPDVRTIFSPDDPDPRVQPESGEGHTFEPGGEHMWCDVCCNYIFQPGLTCAGCKYTCHTSCRDQVSLDCKGSVPSPDPVRSLKEIHSSSSRAQDVVQDKETRTELSREELGLRIQQYNAVTTNHLKMTLGQSGVYTGFIQVRMDLRRPVTVRAGHRGGRGGAGGGVRGGASTKEAFYLPRGAVNTLHVSSRNTVREVIVALLNKFTVEDNAAKYALYKRFCREEQVYVCKLSDYEQPLFLRLNSGPNADVLSFILREQLSGEVMWDAFTVPELQNFLRILEREEAEQTAGLIQKYNRYRHRLREALQSGRAYAHRD